MSMTTNPSDLTRGRLVTFEGPFGETRQERVLDVEFAPTFNAHNRHLLTVQIDGVEWTITTDDLV